MMPLVAPELVSQDCRVRSAESSPRVIDERLPQDPSVQVEKVLCKNARLIVGSLSTGAPESFSPPKGPHFCHMGASSFYV